MEGEDRHRGVIPERQQVTTKQTIINSSSCLASSSFVEGLTKGPAQGTTISRRWRRRSSPEGGRLTSPTKMLVSSGTSRPCVTRWQNVESLERANASTFGGGVFERWIVSTLLSAIFVPADLDLEVTSKAGLLYLDRKSTANVLCDTSNAVQTKVDQCKRISFMSVLSI